MINKPIYIVEEEVDQHPNIEFEDKSPMLVLNQEVNKLEKFALEEQEDRLSDGEVTPKLVLKSSMKLKEEAKNEREVPDEKT